MKSEKLTSFALVIAAVALLIVGAMSYRDYLKAKYEKEFGVAAEGSAPATGKPARANAVEALPPAKPAPTPQAEGAGQIPPAAVAASGTPGSGPSASPPPAGDPKINQYKEDLEALRRENALYLQKLEQTRNGGGTIPPMPDLERAPNVPSSAVAAATGAPVTGSPELPPVPAPPPPPPSPEIVQKEVSAMAERVRKEASIAKVVEYNSEWAFMVLDGGRDRGIEEEMRFAVRRGSEILGWVKITEVEPNRSVAHLMSANKDSKVARKPAKGDDIIAFNLF